MHDSIVIESTGIAFQFKEMIKQLEIDNEVKFIKIDTNPDLCLKRVLSRDQQQQIQVKLEDVKKINEMASKETFNFIGIIDNNLADLQQILSSLKKILNEKS